MLGDAVRALADCADRRDAARAAPLLGMLAMASGSEEGRLALLRAGAGAGAAVDGGGGGGGGGRGVLDAVLRAREAFGGWGGLRHDCGLVLRNLAFQVPAAAAAAAAAAVKDRGILGLGLGLGLACTPLRAGWVLRYGVVVASGMALFLRAHSWAAQGGVLGLVARNKAMRQDRTGVGGAECASVNSGAGGGARAAGRLAALMPTRMGGVGAARGEGALCGERGRARGAGGGGGGRCAAGGGGGGVPGVRGQRAVVLAV